MPIPLIVPLAFVATGWSIRAYADHNKAVDREEDEADGETAPEDDPDAESVMSAITNTEGLF